LLDDIAEELEEDYGDCFHEARESSKDREQESLTQQLRDMPFGYGMRHQQ
jgi:hypothetical protein